MAQFSLSIAERSKADRYPEELRALLPPDWPQVPLVRISTCGPLTIEVLREVTPDHEGGWQLSYGPPEASLLRRKGSSTALTLLRLLVSQSNGFAARDWLMEKLRRGGQPRDELAGGGLIRLDNIVSLLRGLLCPPGLPDEEQLRKRLLSYVPTSGESGGGYRLAGAPLLWLDVEVLAAHVRQARQAEQARQSAQADWKAAYHLGMRGRFLPEEPYSDWAARRREEVESALWQSVQALWRSALARHDEEEAQRLLQTYWQEHVEHEEALRPLLELLGRRGEVQRAEQYYARLCAALDELGQEPDPRTQAIMTSLREKQHQQHVQSTTSVMAFPEVPFTSPLPSSHAEDSPLAAQSITPTLWSLPPASHVADGTATVDADPTLLVGMGLAQSVSALAPLLQQNWSLDRLLDALRVLAPVAKTMPTVSQHTLLQVGMASLVGSLPMVHQKHITEEARLRLCQAFNESIAAGWQLFTMAKHAQVLVASQAQLILLQQIHTAFTAREHSLLSSSIYNLLGMALCQHEHHHKALDAHASAYIAALGAGDALGATYSLLCQANSHYALSQYDIAMETTEQGLRTLNALDDQQTIITKAHLLGVGADCAMMAGDHHLARQKLDKVEILLAHIKPNEEFDRGSWCQLMGKCEYLTGNYRTAAHWYEQALAEVPSEWVLRRALVLTSLISTYTVLQDCEASMMAVEKAVPLPQQLQVPSMSKPLTQALQGLLTVFPYETRITTMVADLLQQIHK